MVSTKQGMPILSCEEQLMSGDQMYIYMYVYLCLGIYVLVHVCVRVHVANEEVEKKKVETTARNLTINMVSIHTLSLFN